MLVDEKTAKLSLVIFVQLFQEYKEEIVRNVRELWDSGYTIPEVQFVFFRDFYPLLLQKVVAANMKNPCAEFERRMALIRDSSTRGDVEPRNRDEAVFIELLNSLDAAKAETEELKLENAMLAAETKEMQTETDAIFAKVKAAEDSFRAYEDDGGLETIDSQIAALREKANSIRGKCATVEAETATTCAVPEKIPPPPQKSLGADSFVAETQLLPPSPLTPVPVVAADVKKKSSHFFQPAQPPGVGRWQRLSGKK
jgi:hypothetical protein